MRGVTLLLRMAQYELEARRADLGSINRARSDTEVAMGALDEAVASETTLAMADPEGMAVFGAWASRSVRDMTRLQDRQAELDRGAHAAQDGLRDTAAQVRRLEIVLDTVRTQARLRSIRRSEARADERELLRRGALDADS